MRIEFDFNIEWFCGGMIIAIASAVIGGVGFQLAKAALDEGWGYFSMGLGIGTCLYIFWTAKCSWYWLSKMFSIHWNRT